MSMKPSLRKETSKDKPGLIEERISKSLTELSGNAAKLFQWPYVSAMESWLLSSETFPSLRSPSLKC